MDEEFEYQGYWWLPVQTRPRCPASSSDGTPLDLLGSLKGLEGVTDTFDPEIILGSHRMGGSSP